MAESSEAVRVGASKIARRLKMPGGGGGDRERGKRRIKEVLREPEGPRAGEGLWEV